MKAVQISHYSDILCVWAYVSQIRIDELLNNFREKVNIEFLFFPVFGNTVEKLDRQWGERGGRGGYSRHVQEIVRQFGHLDVHPDIWMVNVPQSSLPGHLYLCAAQLAELEDALPQGASAELAVEMRRCFFVEARDVSSMEVIGNIIEAQKLPQREFESRINNGKAYAAMSRHMQSGIDSDVRASPTLLFNEGRQRLTGNVGYRIIEANVRELLERPEARQTWC